MGKVTDYVNSLYGFETETTERAVVLGAAAPVIVMPNDPNRLSWTIFNLGAAIGYVAFTSAVAAAFGMQLAAAGGVATSNAREDGDLPTHELWGIGAGATTLYVVETKALAHYRG